MTVTVTHRSGAMEQLRSEDGLDSLLGELDLPDDSEHPDVAVSHESGWTLSAFPNGLVLWENLEDDKSASHRLSVSRTEAGLLFRLLARGEVDQVAASGWSPGYGANHTD